MNAVLHVNVRLLACSLEVLDGCIAAQPSSDVTATTTRGRARGLASELLTVHVPSSVERYATTLLTSLFTSRNDYYSHKVINSRDVLVLSMYIIVRVHFYEHFSNRSIDDVG